MPLTAMIVDDDERFRELVKRLLGTGVRVVGEAARGDDAVLLATQVRPDVVLMSLEISGLDAIAATHQIKAALPRTKVILVTPSEEQAYLSSTGKTGADAQLAKRAVRTEVLSCIRTVAGLGSAWDGRDRRGPGITSGRWDGTERRRSQPSAETTAAVPEPSTPRRTERLLELVARQAALVIDSSRLPAPAGVRVLGPSARRLLYKAGRFLVLLRVEPRAESDRLSLVGQILDEGIPKKPLHGLPVLVSRGGRTVDRTLTNPLGEFLLEPDPAKNLRISFEAPEIGSFVVSLPFLGGGGGDGPEGGGERARGRSRGKARHRP